VSGYKIRSGADNQQVVNSKTVRSVKKVEEALLKNYERFLNHLLKMRKSPDREVQLQVWVRHHIPPPPLVQ
jgi:hypothetical protein